MRPRRAEAKRVSSAVSRAGGSVSISALAASMRNFGFEVRAGAPRRSHASSLRSRFCLRSQSVPRVVADLVEEPAVVGDDEQRGPALPQVPGQPGDALDVQVVRRLVEQDQQVARVRLDQRLGQRDAPPLAAGERADDRVEALRETRRVEAAEQAGDHVADLRLPGPLVLLAAAEQLRADRGVGIEFVVLADHDQVRVAAVHDASRVGLLQLGQQLEQGRLAAAVASDHADPVAFGQAERHSVQQRAGAVGLAD